VRYQLAGPAAALALRTPRAWPSRWDAPTLEFGVSAQNVGFHSKDAFGGKAANGLDLSGMAVQKRPVDNPHLVGLRD